jgi:hypothetical protein
MQQALEALEILDGVMRRSQRTDAAITALKQALAEHDRLAGIEAIEKDAGIHVSQQAEPEQEPDGISWLKRDSGYFTAPTPRKPLTDEEIVTIWRQHNEQYNPYLVDGLVFARAIERKHGIGEQHD